MKRLLTIFFVAIVATSGAQVRLLTTQDSLNLLTTRWKAKQDSLFFALGLAGKAPISHTHFASDITVGILPIARGGTGTASPGLVAGTNVTITGTWPNQTISALGGGGSGSTDTSSLSARIDARVKYTDTAGMLSPYLRSGAAAATYLTNITGKVSAGTNVTVSGSGTSVSPYVINATGGSSAPPATLVYVATLMGQSNSLGVAPSDSLYFSPLNAIPDSLTSARLFDRVLIYDRYTNTLAPLQIGTNNQASSDSRYTFGNVVVGTRTFGPELGIGYRFISQVLGNSKLVIVKESRDGQAIATFQEGHANNWYAGMLARRRSVDSLISVAGWYQVPGQRHFVWTQGEADGSQTQSYYEAQLDTLITHLKGDSVITGRVVIGNVSSTSTQYGSGPDAAKVHWVNTHTAAYLIKYPDGPGYYNSDLLHMNHKGQLWYGYDAFQAAFASNRWIIPGTTYTTGGGSTSGFPTSGVVAYWKLDEPSGNFISTVGSYPLVRNNGVATSTGKILDAADFTASSTQYLSGSSASAFSATSTGFSITGWVNVGSGVIENIVSKAGGTSSNEYGLYADNVSNLLHCYYSTTGSGGTDFATPMTMGAWQFFALVFDGTQLKLSVNAGTPATSSTTSVYNGSGVFLIGQNPIFSGYPMNGKIDEVGVWNRALTSGEISALYNSGSGLTHP